MNEERPMTNQEILDLIDALKPTPQELVHEIEPDRLRLQKRLDEVLSTYVTNKEARRLQRQLNQINRLILLIFQESDDNKEAIDALYSELFNNGGLTRMGIPDPEHKIVDLNRVRIEKQLAKEKEEELPSWLL